MVKLRIINAVSLILVGLFGLFFAATEINGCNGGIKVYFLQTQKVIVIDEDAVKREHPDWKSPYVSSKIADYVAGPYINALSVVSFVALLMGIVNLSWGHDDARK